LTTQSIRVGVVGVGYLGAIHARIYAAMPGVELVGVTDIDGQAATRVAEECGCSAYNESEALLDKVDAVSIVVPTSSHRVVAESYLRHGMHVLLEKPIADHLTNARAIVKAAEEAGVILQIGHLERFNAGVVRLVQELDRPRFIEVHRLGPFVSRAADVDVVTDLMIHDIDIVLSLVTAELTYVSAVGARVVSAHVDIANARLEFSDNTIANVTASRVSSRKFRRIRVFGEACYLGLDFVNQQVEVSRRTPHIEASGFPGIQTESIEVDTRPPLDAELEHFVACVRDGRQPLVTGMDGVRALEVAGQVRRKIAESLHIIS
jgi:predicted dehydrogenase